MKITIPSLLTLAALAFAPALPAAEKAATFTAVYEEVTYSFESAESLKNFNDERAASVYHRLGGKAAIDAAVDLFYIKVLADDRVNFMFEDINMARQHRQQKAFLSAALGSPIPYTGKDMRAAHSNLDITEEHFVTIAEHLQATLVELEVDEKLIAETMAIVATTKDDVLGK